LLLEFEVRRGDRGPVASRVRPLKLRFSGGKRQARGPVERHLISPEDRVERMPWRMPWPGKTRRLRYSATGAQSIPETVDDSQNLPPITTEGTMTISYFATDNAGNQESPAKTPHGQDQQECPPLDTYNSDGSARLYR
jgi:hypothetical protein